MRGQGSEWFTPDWGLTPDGRSRQLQADAREKLVSETAAAIHDITVSNKR